MNDYVRITSTVKAIEQAVKEATNQQSGWIQNIFTLRQKIINKLENRSDNWKKEHCDRQAENLQHEQSKELIGQFEYIDSISWDCLDFLRFFNANDDADITKFCGKYCQTYVAGESKNNDKSPKTGKNIAGIQSCGLNCEEHQYEKNFICLKNQMDSVVLDIQNLVSRNENCEAHEEKPLQKVFRKVQDIESEAVILVSFKNVTKKLKKFSLEIESVYGRTPEDILEQLSRAKNNEKPFDDTKKGKTVPSYSHLNHY